MLTPITFAMTVKAEEYIRSRLNEPEPGRKPSLVTGFAYGDGLSDAIWYEGEHFQIIYEDQVRWEAAQHLELFGHQVAIGRDTLYRLTNRILALHTIPLESNERHVLVFP